MSILATYNASKKSRIFSIIAVNALPLIGVLFLEWDSFFLILAYWLESMALWISKIIIYGRRDFFSVIIFSVPYAVFTVGIIVLMSKLVTLSISKNSYALDLNLLISVTSLCLYVFLTTFLEVKLSSLKNKAAQTHTGAIALFKRAIVLYFTIIIAGILIGILDNVIAVALAIVSVKLAFDLHYSSNQ